MRVNYYKKNYIFYRRFDNRRLFYRRFYDRLL